MLRQARNVKLGEFVKRVRSNGTVMLKVYRKGTYDRSERKYWLDDVSDISRGILVKPDTPLDVGFTY